MNVIIFNLVTFSSTLKQNEWIKDNPGWYMILWQSNWN